MQSTSENRTRRKSAKVHFCLIERSRLSNCLKSLLSHMFVIHWARLKWLAITGYHHITLLNVRHLVCTMCLFTIISALDGAEVELSKDVGVLSGLVRQGSKYLRVC